MDVIVAGSRGVSDFSLVARAIQASGFAVSRVVSGCAPGVDRIGERWAALNGLPVVRCPANWALHGRSAGMIRNSEMANKAGALVAVWDGHSTGTANMIKTAKAKGLAVFVLKV